MECTTLSTESHSSQFQDTYSLHTRHEEYGFIFEPHPLHDPLLNIVQ